MGTYASERKGMSIQQIAGAAFVRIFAPILLLATTFPYVQIISSGSYTQPQAFVLGLILFPFSLGGFSHLRRSDKAAIFSLGFVGILLFLVTCSPYDNIKEYQYLLAYLNPLLMVPVFISAIHMVPKKTVKILQGSIAIWLLVSAIQFLINPQFATSLLGAWGGSAMDIISSGRGVLGLAPEPTHNAFHTLLLGASLCLLDNSKLSRFLIIGCIVSAIIFAASSSAVLVLMMSLIVWILKYKTFWGIVFITAGIGFVKLIPLMSEAFLTGDARLIVLLNTFLENPTNILVEDYSVNTRLGGLWVTLADSIQSGLLPNGLSHNVWQEARVELLSKHDWLLDLSLGGPPSGFGLLLFQGGILTIPFLVIFMRRVLKNQPNDKLSQILVLAVPFIFLSQFYISTPMFSLVYACIIYRQQLKRYDPVAGMPDQVSPTPIYLDSQTSSPS